MTLSNLGLKLCWDVDVGIKTPVCTASAWNEESFDANNEAASLSSQPKAKIEERALQRGKNASMSYSTWTLNPRSLKTFGSMQP